MDTQQQTFVEMMEALNKRMEQLLQKTLPPGSSTSSLVTDFAAFKTFTVQILREFQLQLGLIAQNVDYLEMDSRRKIFLFHGVPEEEQENTTELVVRIVTGHLKYKTVSVKK